MCGTFTISITYVWTSNSTRPSRRSFKSTKVDCITHKNCFFFLLFKIKLFCGLSNICVPWVLCVCECLVVYNFSPLIQLKSRVDSQTVYCWALSPFLRKYMIIIKYKMKFATQTNFAPIHKHSLAPHKWHCVCSRQYGIQCICFVSSLRWSLSVETKFDSVFENWMHWHIHCDRKECFLSLLA